MARWNSCNILQTAPGANQLWQFDAKNFALSRETSSAPGQPLPAKFVEKSWTSLWQPKMNIAWLPPENIFLRVIELPKSNFDETLSMVEFQLEKLSPVPVTQIVWTLQILPQAPVENLQTVIVVIVERRAVEDFLGKLEAQGFLADRLEVPMLDQLQSAPPQENGAWIYPGAFGGKNAALVAWWVDGALRNLSLVVLPPDGDRAKNLKDQLAQLTWAAELEGWLAAPPKWHLVAEGALADEWGNFLRAGPGELPVTKPLPPVELAARTARRATEKSPAAVLLPADFSARYHQQLVDRLWLRGLLATGILYAVCVMIYFCATYVLGYQTHKVEQQVAAISNDYTNALQLKARYDVLKERADLKFAALDCLKIVAEQLPPNISLQRFSFEDGQQLSLSGTAVPDQINTLLDFNSAIQKATLNGQPMFNPSGGEPLAYHQNQNVVTWNFSLQLQHAEEPTP